jgi:2-hydroxy-3-oxopropionate reductase
VYRNISFVGLILPRRSHTFVPVRKSIHLNEAGTNDVDVGFIGLGVMGLPMAANVQAAGHTVRAYARRDEVRTAARERGIEIRDTIAEAVAGADLVITVLTDGPAVIDVALGDEGILATIASGAADPAPVYVDMSTISPNEWAEVADAFADRGVPAIDAPVSGGEQGAAEGVLSIMAGGDAAALARAADALGAMGTVTHVGGPGAGQVVKAANQLIVAGTIQLVAEALVLLERGEVDAGTALDVLGRGLAGSTVIQRKRDALLSRSYRPGFRLELHAKDLGIVADAARTGKLSLPLTAAVTQLVNASVAGGKGALDHSALYELALEANGLANAPAAPASVDGRSA